MSYKQLLLVSSQYVIIWLNVVCIFRRITSPHPLCGKIPIHYCARIFRKVDPASFFCKRFIPQRFSHWFASPPPPLNLDWRPSRKSIHWNGSRNILIFWTSSSPRSSQSFFLLQLFLFRRIILSTRCSHVVFSHAILSNSQTNVQF